MDSLYAIGLGLGLRVLIDTVTHSNAQVDGVLIGLWEGAVLNHFLYKFPTSMDPYVSFAFRLFVDFVVTANFTRLTVVVLWTGLGVILSDLLPEIYRDKRFRAFTRPFRRWLSRPNLDFFSFPSVRSSSRTRRHHRSSSTTPSGGNPPSIPTPNRTSHSRHPVPGRYHSETDASSITNISTPAAQVMPPGIQFSPPRQRPIVSPGPSILSNRGVKQVVSPGSGRRVVISSEASAPSSAGSAPKPTQLPLSPPPTSLIPDPEDLEYEPPTPPRDRVLSTSPPLIIPAHAIPVNYQPVQQPKPSLQMPKPELRRQPSMPVPPLQEIPEVGPEEMEERSPEKKGYDALDVLTTPPGMKEGSYINDYDPLTTPPGVTTSIDKNDRPPSYHYLPFSSAHDQEPPPANTAIPRIVPETSRAAEGLGRFDDEKKSKAVDGSTKLSEIPVRAHAPVRGQSIWGGSVKADSIKGAPSIKGGQSVWGGSQKEVTSVMENREPPKSMQGGSLWGSVFGGGSMKEVVSEVGDLLVRGAQEKGDPSVYRAPSDRGDASIQGDPTKEGNSFIHAGPLHRGDISVKDPSIRDDPSIRGDPSVKGDRGVPSVKGGPSVPGDPSINGDPSACGDPSIRGSVRGDPSAHGDPLIQGSARGDLSLRDSVKDGLDGKTDVASNHFGDNRSTVSKPTESRLEMGGPEKTADELNTKIIPPHFKSVENMKIEQALQATDKAYKAALKAGAPSLTITLGSGKNLRKRLVRMLEDQHGVKLEPSDGHELIVPIPT